MAGHRATKFCTVARLDEGELFACPLLCAFDRFCAIARSRLRDRPIALRDQSIVQNNKGERQPNLKP